MFLSVCLSLFSPALPILSMYKVLCILSVCLSLFPIFMPSLSVFNVLWFCLYVCRCFLLSCHSYLCTKSCGSVCKSVAVFSSLAIPICVQSLVVLSVSLSLFSPLLPFPSVYKVLCILSICLSLFSLVLPSLSMNNVLYFCLFVCVCFLQSSHPYLCRMYCGSV